jgi:hypothetical protein
MRDPSKVNWAGVADILFRRLNPGVSSEDSEYPRLADCVDCGREFQQNGSKHVRCRPCNRIEWQKRALAARVRK